MTDLSQVHLVALTGALDRSGGAERAFRAIIDGFEHQLGMRVSLAAHIQPEDPEVRTRATILRPDGEAVSHRMVTRMRALIATAPRPAILFGFQINSNVVASLANRSLPPSRRLPIVLNDRAAISEMLEVQRGAGVLGNLRGQIFAGLVRSTYRGADAVVCNAKANARLIREWVGAAAPPIETIYNPLDARGFQSRFPERDRKSFQTGEVPLLVSHGRLHPQKGFDTLLRALERLLRRGVQARLRIIGDGPERGALEDLVHSLGLEDAVEMPGFSPDPWAAIEEGDLYVLPSRFEGLPNSLLEAIAIGLPSIAADCPTGPSEILDPAGQVGALFPVDDVEALTNEIQRLLDDGLVRNRMARAARRRALDFSPEVSSAAYGALFQRVLDSVHS
ncbi:glycosyltransferase [Myxococcota bacterium]|nr:glycosyltransferase [Myxococcota bacterium]